MIYLLKALHLCSTVMTTWPEVPVTRACPAAYASVLAETERWNAEFILAVGYHETGLTLTKVGSRHECGPMQVWHRERDRKRLCRAASTSAVEGYQQGVDRLDLASDFCWSKEQPGYTCVLNVYACGTAEKCWRRKTKGEAAREFLELEERLLCNLWSEVRRDCRGAS